MRTWLASSRNRPFKWVLAFLLYAKECNRNCRCKQEVDDAGACKEFTMLLKFQETKQVSVCIKLTTGYVSIKGADFQTWIDSNFCLVAKHVDTEKVSLEDENQLGKEESGAETKDRPKQTKENDKENDDVAQLWEENKSLKNALAILEKAVQAMQAKECNCKNDVDEESVRRIFDKKVIDLEKLYDSKLLIFRKTLEHDYRTEIKEAKKVLSNKIENLRDDFVKLKQSSEAENNGMAYKVTNLNNKLASYVQSKPAKMNEGMDTELRESMAEIEARLKEVANNIEFLKNGTQGTHSNDIVASEIKSINGKLDSHVININQFTSAIHQKLNSLIISHAPTPPHIPSMDTVNHPPITHQYPNTLDSLTNPSAPTETNKDIPSQQAPSPLPLMNIICDRRMVLDGSKQEDTSQLQADTHRFLSEIVAETPADTDSIPTDENTELLILIDSNSKHVDRRQFWKLDNTKWKRCGMISEAMKAIHETQYTKLQYVLVSIGVNDTDDEDGLTVARRLSELIHIIKQKYPNSKIILNELTPRNDPRDKEVIECNGALFSVAEKDANIFLAKQSNLRDREYSFFFDVKHVKSNKIGRYVSNIKIALRKAYGIADPRHSSMHHGLQARNNISPSSRWSFQPRPEHSYNNRMNLQRKQRTVNHQAIQDSQYESTMTQELKYEIRKRLFALFD